MIGDRPAGDVTIAYSELQARALALGVEELPAVLGRGPGRVCGHRLAADDDGAAVQMIRGLATAAGHLAARRVCADGTARLCVADGPGPAAVAAGRGPGEDAPVTLGPAGGRYSELQRFLGRGRPARTPVVRVPLEPLRTRLRTDGTGGCAAAFEACGADPAAAGAVARIMDTATAWTEIVLIACVRGTERRTRAAMVVYDSPHGRLAATPAAAPDGAVWMTFGPGDGGRIGRGIAALDRLGTDA